MCMSNERQLTLALMQYIADWQGGLPHNENNSFTQKGRPDRNFYDSLGLYLGHTSSWEIPGVGSFPGYLLTDDPAGFGVFNDPGREPWTSAKPRGGPGQYRGIGGFYMIVSEADLRVSEDYYMSVDDVNVPSKNVWLWGADYSFGSTSGSVDQWQNAVHQGAINVAFIDGHARTYDAKPINEDWEAGGGSVPPVMKIPTWKTGGRTYGVGAYTYPPADYNFGDPSGADWWTVPWYPSTPHGYIHPSR